MPHDSVSVIVPRFTSVNQDFVLCCYHSLPNFAARGVASPVRLLHIVQVVLALLHFAVSVFQEVTVNSFPVTLFLIAIQAVTDFQVLVRRPVTGFVTVLLVLVHSYSHFWTTRSTKFSA